MACHKTLKAGDRLYIGEVKILAATKTTLSIEAEPSVLIAHASEHKSGDYNNETKNIIKE